MNKLTCYKCNEPLNSDEQQRWQPFGLCDDCTLNHVIAVRIAQGNKEAVHLYWTQSPHEQHRLRLLFAETKEVS